jgi:hypothetical protein
MSRDAPGILRGRWFDARTRRPTEKGTKLNKSQRARATFGSRRRARRRVRGSETRRSRRSCACTLPRARLIRPSGSEPTARSNAALDASNSGTAKRRGSLSRRAGSVGDWRDFLTWHPSQANSLDLSHKNAPEIRASFHCTRGRAAVGASSAGTVSDPCKAPRRPRRDVLPQSRWRRGLSLRRRCSSRR